MCIWINGAFYCIMFDIRLSFIIYDILEGWVAQRYILHIFGGSNTMLVWYMDKASAM